MFYLRFFFNLELVFKALELSIQLHWFVKVPTVLVPATLLKVSCLHGCFSRFLNCTNCTKSYLFFVTTPKKKKKWSALKGAWGQSNNFCLKWFFCIIKQNCFNSKFQKFTCHLQLAYECYFAWMASLTLRRNLIIQNFVTLQICQKWSKTP